MMNAAYVIVTGPESGGVSEYSGCEFPVWGVSICDTHDDELKGYTVNSFSKALSLGQKIATDRRLELVNDATPAGRY
jgi:hypothetical protein